MRPKLQLALDDIALDEALELVDKIQESIDIVEIGTPFMMEYGMEAVRKFKEHFPALEILCDGKIMDAGGYEASLAYQAGADYVTVLAVTDDLTIADVVAAAKKATDEAQKKVTDSTGENVRKKVMADMICVSDLKERLKKLEELGVDVISVHTGVDQQAMGRTPLDDLKEMHSYVEHTPIAVAGGVNAQNVDDYLVYEPSIVIAGGGIVHAKDPVKAARTLAEKLKRGKE
ncbi:MAG: 3-hexulose-6-phosphate synthase [Lachnospiraceae bacterium]